MKKSQVEIIIEHLERNGHITSMEAFSRYKITRLAAVISLIKKRGYNITSECVINPDRIGHYARYWLNKEEHDVHMQ